MLLCVQTRQAPQVIAQIAGRHIQLICQVLTLQSLKVFGTIEITSIILFIIPRTGILGALLLTAYLSGAIAIHLEHGPSIATPSLVEAVL